MQRILALHGDPSADSTCDQVLRTVLAAAEESGAQTELVHLASLGDLNDCDACLECQAVPDRPGCATQDDMQDVYARIMAADVVLWAAGRCDGTVHLPLGRAVDRLYCMFKYDENGQARSLLEGRRMAAIFMDEDAENAGQNATVAMCRRLALHGGTEWMGTFSVQPNAASEDGQVAESVLARARAFGKWLCG